MAQNQRARKPISPLSPRIARLVRESWLLLVGVGIVYLVLILATFNRADPGWSQSGALGQPLRNTGGPFGAWLSDLMYISSTLGS